MASRISRESSSLEEGLMYRAMRECNAMMVDLLKPSIESLGDALFAKQLIPLDVKDNLGMIALSPANKTRKVIDCITGRVKYNPQSFHEFVSVLKEQGSWTDVVVDQLLSCYQSQTATPQPSTLPPSGTQSSAGQVYTLPSNVIELVLKSVRVSSLQKDQNQSVIESLLRVERDNYTQPQPNIDTQIQWNIDPKYLQSAIGTRDALVLVSKVGGSSVVPRRNRAPLTEEEKHKLQEEGIHEDLCLSDLSIMMGRYDLDKYYTSAGVLTGEKRTCEEVRQRITELFNTTDKEGVKLHYIGPGQKKTGNWCFKDGFISFEEIMKLYTRHLKPRVRVLTIISDCSYSGRWVKEAMAFMDGQGVGPCGHVAKEKGVLVKVCTSCLANEVPAELAFSTNCVRNDESNGRVFYCINGKEIHDGQHTSGIDFTGVRCNNEIDEPCTMAPRSTWQQWSKEQRTKIVTGKYKGRPVWHYLLLVDDEKTIQAFNNRIGRLLNATDYGQCLKSGWGEDPPEETKKWIKDNYHVNYNY